MSGLTVAEYARAKQLPAEFLLDRGVRDDEWFGEPALAIPYLDQDGHEFAVRLRLSMNGPDPFRWPTGTKAKGLVYGLDGWKRAAAAGWALLVEGESCVQTARLHGIPAFGIPGALMFDDELTSPCLEAIARLFPVQEPGEAGERFLAALRGSRLADRLSVMSFGEHKDVSAVHLAVDGDHERFVAAIEEAKTAAMRPGLALLPDDDNPIFSGRTLSKPAPVEIVENGDEPFRLEPVDWPTVVAAGVPKIEYLDEPYLPARKRIWGVGPAESGKSIWAAWKATQLTRAGLIVVYVSQENGLEEELRRFLRMRPDFGRLRLYVDQGLDLMIPEHRAALFEVSAGAGLVTLDTLTACWSGDGDSNDEVIAFDREVTKPLMVAGTSSLVLDHTGNPQPFTRRRGVSAPRGASSKGQKTDFLLEFRTGDDGSFQVERSKKRGTHGKEPRRYVVVDGSDDELELIESEVTDDVKLAEIANSLVEIVQAREPLSTGALRLAGAEATGAGTTAISDAMKLLEGEVPPRVVVDFEVIETDGGRQRAKAWRLADHAPETPEELW